MTEVWVDLEFHMKVKVDVPEGTPEEDVFEKAYEKAMSMDPSEFKYRQDLEYWEVM